MEPEEPDQRAIRKETGGIGRPSLSTAQMQGLV